MPSRWYRANVDPESDAGTLRFGDLDGGRSTSRLTGGQWAESASLTGDARLAEVGQCGPEVGI